MDEKIVLGKALGFQSIPGSLTLNGDPVFNDTGRNYLPGYQKLGRYHDHVKSVRWFYTYDPIASTVVNRMADMAMTTIRNRKKTKLNADVVDDATQAYFDALIIKLRPFIKQAALEYLLHGMVIPEYTLIKKRGDLLSERLGRKRYVIPDALWIRNPDNIELRRRPIGTARQVFLKIPLDDIAIVQNKGIRSDGTVDKEAYTYLVERFPAYVAAIRAGKTRFELLNVIPIMRKLTSYEDYPTPFLVNALSALQHKVYLKTMDKAIASRAIEAVRQVKVGSDDFPADDDDISATKTIFQTNASTGERVFTVFTNHTVDIIWSLPPLDALLNEAKYAEPNADIFLAMGFPRILTTGETLRSNSSDSKIASLGPKATLEDLREAIIVWLTQLYELLGEQNNFPRVPEPYFAPIATSDYTALVQFAVDAMNAGAISKDTIAQLYGSDFETEANQITTEQESGVLSPAQLEKEKERQFQEKMTNEAADRQAELQKQQTTQNNNQGNTKNDTRNK